MNDNKTYVEFDSKGNHYIYDRFSNEFLCVQDSLLKDGHLCIDAIEKLQKENGLLLPYVFPKLSISNKESLEGKISNKLNRQIVQICFITTENCNLRCKYCVYSGAYENKRSHNFQHEMSWDTAKKVLDFFLSKGAVNTISFYGGESLIEYKLIKQIAEYARVIDDTISFSMNTNLTLLNDDILDFLIRYDFAITISLDGPKEVHDLYRVSLKNKPTHDIVEKNLVHIREQNEKYFLKKVFYNVLIVPHNLHLGVVDKYFCKELFDKVPLDSFRVLTLNSEENTFSSEYNYYSFLAKYKKYSSKLFLESHVNGYVDFSEMKISYRFQVLRIKKILYRDMRKLDAYSFYWPNGICILGLRSVIVTSNGTFYPCQTLYDRHEMPIGNVREGVNNADVVKYTREYIEYGNKLCKKCWAFRFCAHCFTYAFEQNKYSIKKKLAECEFTRKNLIEDFIFFMEIYSQNPKAFDYLLEEEPYEKFSYMMSD